MLTTTEIETTARHNARRLFALQTAVAGFQFVDHGGNTTYLERRVGAYTWHIILLHDSLAPETETDDSVAYLYFTTNVDAWRAGMLESVGDIPELAVHYGTALECLAFVVDQEN